MIALTKDQSLALESAGSLPSQVMDPATKQTYVLIPLGTYERIQALLDDDIRKMEPLLGKLAPEDWEDASAYVRI